MTRRGLDTKTFGVLSTPTVGDFLNLHGGSQKENPLQLAGCLPSTGPSFLPAFSFSSRGCLCDGWNLLPDLWSLTDSTRVFPGLRPSATFPSRVWTLPGVLGPWGLWADSEAPCLSVQTNTAPAVLRAFSQHCSEVTAQVKRQEETCLPIGASGELLGQTQAPPCSRLCPQGCDSLTKQLGSVVTPSQLGEKKSLQLTPTQPLCFPSSGAPAFRKEETRHCLSLTYTPRGIFLRPSPGSGDVFLEILPTEGMLRFTLFPGRGWRNFHSVIGIGNGWVGRNGSKAIRGRECFQSTWNMTKSGVCLPSAHLLVTLGPLAHLISESGDYVKQQALSRCNHAALSHIYSRCGYELCEWEGQVTTGRRIFT